MNSLRHKKHGSKDTETKNPWCNWLISYISEIVKVVGGVKNKIMNLFKKNTTEDYSKTMHVNNMNRGGMKPRKSKLKDNQKTKYLRW